MAILQNDVKRMLAFSSVSHAGYVLIAVQAATDQGTAAALFYLFTYTFMVLGTFAVVGAMGRDDEHPLTNYAGLRSLSPSSGNWIYDPPTAQAGIPTTSGFVAKSPSDCRRSEQRKLRSGRPSNGDCCNRSIHVPAHCHGNVRRQ